MKGHGCNMLCSMAFLEVTVRCAWPEEAIADISEGGSRGVRGGLKAWASREGDANGRLAAWEAWEAWTRR